MNDIIDRYENIKEVNLISLTAMSNIFLGCNNLKNIDISTCHFINREFFNGINSRVYILSKKDLLIIIRNEIKILHI